MLLDSAYPSLRGGGAEMQVRTLAKGLRARGQRVTVAAPLTPVGPQRRVARVDGIPVCRLPYLRLRLIAGPWLWLRLSLFLLSRRRRYDVWHVHLANRFGAVSAVLGHWLDKPVVVKVAGANEIERGPLSPHASPIARLAYRGLLRAYAWQAISQRITTILKEKGVSASRIAAIPNAVDMSRFRGIARENRPGLRFLFIGRLVREKNLITLLDAFAGAFFGNPHVLLQIVGTGPLEASLRKRALDLGIAPQLEFAGHREDIEALTEQADYGVLPSSIEGLSNTLLECMASGLPMIASRVSGNEDLVRTGENGWLFEPFDRTGLISCLKEAASLSPERRREMGDNARNTVECHAGLDSVIDRLLTLYEGHPTITMRSLPFVKEGV